MFGYVRPLRSELKVRDDDLYRAAYCGLCRCLRRRYGAAAPMTLSFDCVFLALLLWEPERDFVLSEGHCLGNPLKKRPMCGEGPALDRAADVGVVLSWWKLRDDLRDGGFWAGLPARGAKAALRGAYRAARERLPEFDAAAGSCLGELGRLERENCPSIDRTADAFARLLRAAAPAEDPRARVLEQLLYHLGRWIYLIDARDDLREDLEAGRYNPVAARYGRSGDDGALKLTLDHSLELMGAAFQLGNFGGRTPVLENILYLGLPAVQRAVFDGSWAEVKKQKIWRDQP